ncbi:hypothetical protein FQN60_013832, partial [Etheostoma spectabile]
NAVSKSLQCEETHYLKGSRCCNKCEPGFRVLRDCTDSQKTICVKCNRGEYQPGLTENTRCIQQKFCDPGKGFMERSENPVAEEPCRCPAGFQCHLINCMYCEKIPTCNAGYGLEVDPESSERKTCVACKKGFFSADNTAEQCRQWTKCSTLLGYRFSALSHHSSVSPYPAPLLLQGQAKDTLAPLYHSGPGGGTGAGPKCSPCETTKLICQAPHSPADELTCIFPTSVPDVRVSLPFLGEMKEEGGNNGKTVMADQSKGSGEPEEVSEEDEVVSVSPLLAGSCVCVIPVREPLEVGENEDCSQAVSPGTPGTCSCGGLDGERDGYESGKEEKSGSIRADNSEERGEGNQTKMVLSKSETGVASLVSISPRLLHTSSVIPPSSPLPELCLPLSQAQVRAEFKPQLTDSSLVKQEELYRLASTDSTSTENSTISSMTSVSPLMTSSSVGDLYLDKPPEGLSLEQGQGLTWGDNRGNKLSSGESELECSPESLHSQVSGNHNTTFISSGQVMNFSGDVIVVYVSHTSLGSDGAGQDDAFGRPVQEEANETAPFFQNSLMLQRDSICKSTLQDNTLLVQGMMEECPMGK